MKKRRIRTGAGLGGLKKGGKPFFNILLGPPGGSLIELADMRDPRAACDCYGKRRTHSGVGTMRGSPVGPIWKTVKRAPSSLPAVRATMGLSGSS